MADTTHTDMTYAPGQSVWLSDAELGWVAAEVTAVTGAGDVVVQPSDAGRSFSIPAAIARGGKAAAEAVRAKARGGRHAAEVRYLLSRTAVAGERGADNMDDMVELHEASVLANLQFRFTQRDLIYTRYGTSTTDYAHTSPMPGL